MTALTRKVHDIENTKIRNDLVFRGLGETSANETAGKSEELIVELRRIRLHVTALSTERAHRIRTYRAGKARPVTGKFTSYKYRQSVITNAYKLKGSSYKVSADFLRSIRGKRKKLWDYAKLKKQEGEKAVLNYDTLHLRGKRFQLDISTEELVQL